MLEVLFISCMAILITIDDFCFLRVHNLHTFILLIFSPWMQNWHIGLAVLAISFLMYKFDLWGGGDAKLLPVVCLYTNNFHQCFNLLMIIAAIGGIIAIAWKYYAKFFFKLRFHLVHYLSQKKIFRLMGWQKLHQQNDMAVIYELHHIPYAIAIILGLLFYKI